MLGKKQSTNNDNWLNALPLIRNFVSEHGIRQLEAETIADIKIKTRGKRAAYAWSGWKDSIVLGALCEKAGVIDCMIGICNLEYPAFLRWIHMNKPASLEIINTGQDMEWLTKHPEMLFPDVLKNDPVHAQRAAVLTSKWFSIVQHRAQAKYFSAHKLDVILLGRRRADGNYIGKKNNMYTTASDVMRLNPIAYWTHVLEMLGAELDVPGYDEETLKAIMASANEVSEKLIEYGTLAEHEINSMKATGERMNATPPHSPGCNINHNNTAFTDGRTDNADASPNNSSDTAEIQKSVTCPYCGETIWL